MIIITIPNENQTWITEMGYSACESTQPRLETKKV